MRESCANDECIMLHTMSHSHSPLFIQPSMKFHWSKRFIQMDEKYNRFYLSLILGEAILPESRKVASVDPQYRIGGCGGIAATAATKMPLTLYSKFVLERVLDKWARTHVNVWDSKRLFVLLKQNFIQLLHISHFYLALAQMLMLSKALLTWFSVHIILFIIITCLMT